MRLIKMTNRNLFNTVECSNGNHYFIRYNDSNLICKRCGRFAKVGYLQKEVKNNGTDNT